MAFDRTKPYHTSSSAYYGHDGFATQQDAENSGKQLATQKMEDVAIYKAIALVKAPIPTNVEVEQLS